MTEETNTTCEFYKLEEDFIVNNIVEIEKGRIVMYVFHPVIQPRLPHMSVRKQRVYYYRYAYVLATATKPLSFVVSSKENLKKFAGAKEVDIFDEKWILPHLHKEAKHYIKKSNLVTRTVFVEKTYLFSAGLPSPDPINLNITNQQLNFSNLVTYLKTSICDMLGIPKSRL